MSPLSIFSFNTLQIKVKNLFSVASLLAISALLLLEICLRLVIPDGQIPTGSWYNHTIRLQNAELKKLPQIDLYFIGTSISCVNIPPADFDAALAESGIENTAFNAGIAGPDFRGVAAAMKFHYWPQKQSRKAVLVIAPNDLNSANTAVCERTKGYIKSFEQSALAAATIDFLSHFYIFGFRAELKNYFKKGWQYDPVNVGEKGFTPLPRRQRPRWETAYRIDPDGPLAASLFDLTDWLAARDVQIILIEGLSEPAEKNRISPVQWQNFNRILTRCASKPNVHPVDVSTIEPPAEDFVDQLHIHENAARRYARNLANLLRAKQVFE